MHASIGEKVARRLVERELTLGTVECGEGGIVSRRLFDTDQAVNVLGNSLVLEDVGDAIGLMALPRPQFEKAGDFSAKAARAAAREGRGFLGVSLCVAVWARQPVTTEEKQTVHVALNTARRVIHQTHEVGGETGRDAEWLADRALQMLWEALDE
ncbi:MAG: CinA family protein [Anaerolineae bacterium]|jgi:nicotinamide mononucleotide (NMN) deamidase PncC